MAESMKPEDAPPESPWAVEGTRAHTLGELELAYRLQGLGKGPYLTRYKEWRKTVSNEEAKEMQKFIEGYVSYVAKAMEEMGAHTVLMLERRVHPGVPSSWGTSDVVLVAPTRIRIIDLKYGTGIQVSAVNNPQLMLYGVGALEEYGDVIADTEQVEMSIYQPRLDWHSSFVMDADDLRTWRDSVIPIAEEALGDDAHFGPGEEACRFCPAAGVCKARVEYMTALDFAEDPDTLSNDDLAGLLARLPDIRSWCSAVEEAALDRAYSQGESLPGWKVVLSGGKRTIPDAVAAIQTLIDNGFQAEQVARFQLKTLADLEKVVGSKDKLSELLGDQMIRTTGRPSMVREQDPRPAISPASEAKADFAE